MAHVDHGKWQLYTPATVREDAPAGAMFAKRESDGKDWYDHVHPGDNFNPANVVIAAIWRDYANGYVVGPAVYDATKIFPAGHIVYEIDNYTGSDPQADLGSKTYDPATGQFAPVAPPAADTTLKDRLDAIAARLEKLESKP